jgi:protein tyrosine phosphatase
MPPVARKASLSAVKYEAPSVMEDCPTMAEYKTINLHEPLQSDIPICCKGLNRHENILPNPRTRVMLAPPKKSSSKEQTDMHQYINANYITGLNGRKYIATSGPLEHTMDAFWRMIFEQDTSLIICLTGIIEGGIIKCHRYWPNVEKKQFFMKFSSGIEIVTDQTVNGDNMVLSYITVKWNGKKKECTHLHFTGWPDKGVPSMDSLIKIVTFMRSHFELHPKVAAPVAIHCSAGIGRTGAVIGKTIFHNAS